jgi:hypothetical protein
VLYFRYKYKCSFKLIKTKGTEGDMGMERILMVDTVSHFLYNEVIALLNFFSPCTLLCPYGYMLSEVGQERVERRSIKSCFNSKSLNFPVLRAGRKTILTQKLEQKTVHIFDVQKKLIGLSNTSVKAYKSVGLIFVLRRKRTGLVHY